MKKLILFLIVIITFNVYAQQKVALVIGNNDYKEYPLKNAANDANLMERTLKQLGFTVQKVLNASKAEFEKQLALFNRTYKNADVRLFYYAGHGIQLEGENYLVPVDAVLEEKEDVKLEGVDFSTIFSIFQKSKPNAMNIFVMDACRNNPFKNRSWGGRGGDDRGLVLKKSDFTTGSFAAFSADNGQKASDGTINNGLYTQVLAKALMEPGVEINILFQKVRNKVIQLSNGEQSPVEENRLVSDKGFYFIPKVNPQPGETVKTFYYYIDQDGNKSTKNFERQEDAENEMKQNELYGKIYSNNGEIFVVEAPVKPAVTISEDDIQHMIRTAFDYWFGEDGVKQDYAQARIWFKKAADAGNASAMSDLASLYKLGQGGEKDYAQAKIWFEKAANAGDSTAMKELGDLYGEGGYGLTKDCDKAKYWYEKGVNAGNNNCMFYLASLYAGCLKDYVQAKYWYEKAGTGYSMKCIGDLYRQGGYGLTQDYKQTAYWYEKAVNAGERICMFFLGGLYRVDIKDYVQAKYWYERYEKDGELRDGAGMKFIGELYEEGGYGLTQDYNEAKNWYQKAADKGYGDAMEKLGELYENGYGVAQDYAQAKNWYQKAADKDNYMAKGKLVNWNH